MEKKHKKEFVASKNQLLIDFLKENLESKSKNNIKSILKRGSSVINGKPITQFNYEIKKGDKIIIQEKIADPINDVEIIYEDKDFFVINKPVGLLTVPANDIYEKTAYKVVSEYARKNNTGNLIVVHRLDKETSGVLVFVKSEKLKQKLQENWNELVLKRGYCALVCGKVLKKEDKITTLIAETRTKIMYTTKNSETGKEAITNYKVIKTNNKYSLLDINIETGRKNQIRLHMKEMGHPIVGDKKYGAPTNPLRRLGLHANILEIKHPITREIFKFTADIPNNFFELLKK